MKIDPQTGMPELEEGYRWEVRNDKYTYLTIHLMFEEEVKQSRLMRRLLGPNMHWVSMYSIDVIDLVIPTDLTDSKVTGDLIKQGYQKLYESPTYIYRPCLVGYYREIPQTPENIQKVAIELYERIEAVEEKDRKRTEAHAKMQTLVGAYPPKKLVL